MEFFGMTDEIGNPIPEYGERIVPGVTPGAEPELPPIPRVLATDAQGNSSNDDQRVKIRVPASYFTSLTSGPDNGMDKTNLGGIIFPYTPSISFDLKADYTSNNPIHSNFSINFYKSSSISSINISGKFTVESYKDAGFYLATVHLLKALTRMRFGLDPDRGSPPPICRLDAYGEMILKNVPVAITSFKTELPDSVDYFTTYYNNQKMSVPTISTIQVVCLPMYSRNEMQQFSVTGYLDGKYPGQGII